LFAVSADRTAFDVVPALLKATLLEVPRTETVAVIRTASGTTVVVPVALRVMYLVSAADAGAAPLTRNSAVKRAAITPIDFSFIPLLSGIIW